MDQFYFLGQVLILPYDRTPKGFKPCEGQLLPISGNLALFSLLDKTHGDDGLTTFGLPDYRGIAPPNSSYYIAIEGIFPAP